MMLATMAIGHSTIISTPNMTNIFHAVRLAKKPSSLSSLAWLMVELPIQEGNASSELTLVLPASVDESRQQSLLRVQSVLRLPPDDAVAAVDDVVGDLLAPVRRQTVHEDVVVRRLFE